MHSMFRRYWHSIPRMTPKARNGVRLSSTAFILRTPPSNAPREVPTPLVFISASNWDASSSSGMTFLASMLAEKGFTCAQSDLVIPETSKSDSKNMMEAYEAEATSMVRLTTIPFPPVIVARSSACLIAETYISSHPASGMILIDPPASNSELVGTKLPTPLQEFDYEPNFPIAVITTSHDVGRLRESNRICESENVDIIVVEDLGGGQVFSAMEAWLDKLGI